MNLTFEEAKQTLFFTRNSNQGGLAGIWSGTPPEGGYPDGCAADKKCYAAFDLDGKLVAYVSYEVRGDQCGYAHRSLGDQLEAAGFGRGGY